MDTEVDRAVVEQDDGDAEAPSRRHGCAAAEPTADATEQNRRRPWYRPFFGREHLGHDSPPSAEPFARVADRQIRGMLEDNDYRLWYICRYGKAKFDDASLKALVETRQKFVANPDYVLPEAEEVAYLQATMAASEFLGSAEPDAIRLYAQVQNRDKANPLRYWLWTIALFLLLALGVNGYQTLIAAQVQKMQDASRSYFEVAESLSVATPDLEQQLLAMCKHSHEFRLGAGQLSFLLHPLGEGISDAEPTRVCTHVRSWLTSQAIRQPVEPATGPSLDEITGSQMPSETRAAPAGAASPVFDVPIITLVRGARFADAGELKLLLQAQAVQSILATVLLPMFYASLGSLTSALRSANAELKAMTLTRIDNVSLFSRVLLGVVGGATVGIVFKADMPGTGGLTTLGLAFAVGYAVDLFFNVLDGIKSGLGDSGRPSQPKP